MLLLFALIILLALFFLLSRDILSPPVVLCASWIFPLLIVMISPDVSLSIFNDMFYGYYVFGVFLFALGYFATQRYVPKGPKELTIDVNRRFDYNEKTIFIIILVEAIIAILGLYRARAYVAQHFSYNFWFTYKSGSSSGDLELGSLFALDRIFAKSFSCYLLIIAISKKEKKLWILTVAQMVVSTILYFLSSGRSAMFAVLIPLIFIYLFMRRENTAQVLRIVGIAVFGLLLIFGAINYYKYAYSTNNSFTSSLLTYSVRPLLSYKEWCASHTLGNGNGQYLFRFFIAIANRLGFSQNPVPLVEPYINTELGICNVYTFYKWYANDFGIWFALFMQFVFGIFHGALYKRMYQKQSAGLIFLNTMFYYPLVIQFFQDQYISLFSTWVQTIIIYFILFKPIHFVFGKGSNSHAR